MMETAPRLAADMCNCLALRTASRRVSQFYDSRLAPTGLRTAQFAMLSIIHERPDLPVNGLARLLELDRTTTGKNLRPLERAGLVIIRPSANDGRSRKVSLTAEGLAALKAAAPLWRDAQRQFEEGNGPEAAAALRATLLTLKLDN